MKNLLAAIPLLALCGCASYETSILISTPAGTYKCKLPKDATVGTLVIEVPTTNGPMKFYATNCTWKMNPATIDAKTRHDVAIIDATVQGIGTVAGAAAAAGAKP